MPDAIDLAGKLATFGEHWSPRTVTLGPGQLLVVPKGVEHRPVARGEAHLLLIEPTGTPNTGDAATAAPRRLA